MVKQYSLWDITQYFLKLGTWGFGGPVALVGYMQRDLVEDKGWLTEEEYKDGLALAQLAPGPLAAQLGIYIGFVHYGLIGIAAVLALIYIKKLQEPHIIGIAAIIGILIKTLYIC
jgi:chromate transport protein ChrA